jgi:metallo-beta-lactamase class B
MFYDCLSKDKSYSYLRRKACQQCSVLYGGCLVKSTENKDLGYLADADTTEWPRSIRRLIDRYPHAAYIIPGHFDCLDNRSLQHTLDLLQAHS